MQNTINEKVKLILDAYPSNIREQLLFIRELVFKVADQHGIEHIEETTKWGEPSYIAKHGSTLRFDWKNKTPDQLCVYFSCKTTLVETFKEVYGDTFSYEGNRAIVFKVGETVPVNELSHCISMALRYKKIKHLSLLGA